MPLWQNKTMNTLSRAIDLLRKHWIIFIPTFLAVFIPALLLRSTAGNLAAVLEEYSSNIAYYAQNPEALNDLFATVQAGVGSSTLLSTILNIAAVPMTAGLLHRVLSDQTVGFGDFAVALSENIITYLKHVFGLILFGIGIAALSLVYLLLLTMVGFSGETVNLGIMFSGLLLWVLLVATFGVFLTFWFAAMVLEDYPLFAAISRSFSLVKKCFWRIVGVTLVVQIMIALVTAIAGGFAAIPLVGPLLTSTVSAIGTVLMMTFAFVLYKEQAEDEVVFDRNVE